MIHHGLTQSSDYVAAQDDILLYFRIAKIQIAVFQTGILVRLAGMVDLEGQFVITAAAQDLNLFRHHFDVAGRKIRVLGGTLSDRSGHLDRRFLVDRLQFLDLILGLQNDLCRTVEIAKNHESQVASDLTHIFHPADQCDLFTHVGKSQLAAVMCP